MAQQVDELSIKISSNARQAIRDLNALSSSLQRVGTSFRSTGSRLSGLSIGVGKLTRGMTGFGNANGFASKMSKSLTSSLASLALKVFSLTKAFSFLKTGIESAMNFTETVNYFEVAVRDIGRKSASNWQQAGYRSAEEYVNSFTGRLKNLTTNMTGFRIDEYGNTTEVIGPNLGLDPNQVMQYQAMYTQMSSSMGLTADTAVNVSKALTMLGADWASLRNVDFSESWNKMASALAGQSRAVRAYGIDITNARLQEEAYKYGITDNIQTMSQAEKAQLRLLAILDQSKVAYADLANTMMSYSNQIRYMKQQFSNLARVIGNLFLPIIAKVLPYINGLIIAFRRLFEEIARILGISLQGINSSMSGMSDDYFDMADDSGLADMFSSASDSAEDANQSAEKLKRTVLSFDELHLLNDNSKDEDSSSSSNDDNKIPRMGGNPVLDSAIASALGEYESIWSEALARMENKVTQIADRIYAVFQRIIDLIKNRDWVGLGQYLADGVNFVLQRVYDALSFDKLRAGIFDKIDAVTTVFNSWVGRLNFELIGRTIGNGINLISASFNRIYEDIDFALIGEQLAAGVNGLLDEVNFYTLALALSNKLNGAMTALQSFLWNVNWKYYGEKIGKAIRFMFEKYIDWDAIKGALDGLFTAVMDGLSGIFKGLGLDKISQDIDSFKLSIEGIAGAIDWDALKEAIGNLATAITAIGTSVIEDLSLAGIILLNGLAGVINAIADAVKMLPDDFEDILTSFTIGLGVLLALHFKPGFLKNLGGVAENVEAIGTATKGIGLGGAAVITGVALSLKVLGEALGGVATENATMGEAIGFYEDPTGNGGDLATRLERTNEVLPETAEQAKNTSSVLSGVFSASLAGVSSDANGATTDILGMNTAMTNLNSLPHDYVDEFADSIRGAGTASDGAVVPLENATNKISGLAGTSKELAKQQEDASKKTETLEKKTSGFSLKTIGMIIKNGLLSASVSGIGTAADGVTSSYGEMESAGTDAANGIQSAFDGIDIDLSSTGSNAIDTLNQGLTANPIKLPHVSVTGYNRNYLTPDMKEWVDTPYFGIQWWGKGGVFTTPTVAGIGEAGAEAVLPLTNKKTMGMIASSIADSGKAFSGMSADDIQEAVATGVAMAISQNPQIVEVVVNSTLRTSDEKLAQSVSRGRAKLNQRYNPSIVASY